MAFAPELIDEDCLDEAKPDRDGKELPGGTELELIAAEFALLKQILLNQLWDFGFALKGCYYLFLPAFVTPL